MKQKTFFSKNWNEKVTEIRSDKTTNSQKADACVHHGKSGDRYYVGGKYVTTKK